MDKITINKWQGNKNFTIYAHDYTLDTSGLTALTRDGHIDINFKKISKVKLNIVHRRDFTIKRVPIKNRIRKFLVRYFNY